MCVYVCSDQIDIVAWTGSKCQQLFGAVQPLVANCKMKRLFLVAVALVRINLILQ
eukprot:m.176453 g.176453  ORF g.176453 m.176453 type:complete len:55 (+) comp14627_c0_seq41:2037-2201(+)